MRIGIFYGSTTGVTEKVMKKIGNLLEIDKREIRDVEQIERGSLREVLKDYQFIILATPSYHLGDVQKSWEKHLKELGEIEFKDQRVALVGIGNQKMFPRVFAGGVGILNYYVERNFQGILVGKTKVSGYEFQSSSAVKGDEFVGLVIDDKNQEELTEERVKKWIKMIKKEVGE